MGLGDRDLRGDHRRRVEARRRSNTGQPGTASRAGFAALPWVMLGGTVGTLVAPRGPQAASDRWAFERLYYASSLAWFLIVSIELAYIGH
jgi:hypothetical protein